MNLLGKSATAKLIEHLEAQNMWLIAENAKLREQLLALVDKTAHQAVYRKPTPATPLRAVQAPDVMARQLVPLKPALTSEQIEAEFKS